MSKIISLKAAIEVAQDFVQGNNPPFIVTLASIDYGYWRIILLPYINGKFALSHPDQIELKIYSDGRLEIVENRE